MELFYAFVLTVGFSHLGVAGRPVNISSAWFLPQDGFSVFYRYFGEKLTWNEAQEVCRFHHADLLSVETSTQMDAARAYLKEIDVTDNVWIGLQKESPEKPFSWTNGDKLLGDGYWTEPIPKTNEKLCAAVDPVADFRWNSFYCRGPQLASFVCELAVPEWAKKENGCLITSLPSLTITLVPEVGVIQLLSDCGLDGTRRIACNAGLNREEIIKRLSCDVDAFASTAFGRSTTAGALREINTQQSLRPDVSNFVNRYETTKSSSHTRHRRSADSVATNTAEVPVRGGTDSPPKSHKATSATSENVPPRPSPSAPRPPPTRDALPETKPPTFKATERSSAAGGGTRESADPPPSTECTAPAYEGLPVLVITGEKPNESASSATSENPEIVLMIENKNPDEPFLVPLPDDIFIDPSLSPVELIDVDLVEVGNLTSNGTGDRAQPEAPAVVRPPKLVDAAGGAGSLPDWKLGTRDAEGESSNAVEEDGGAEAPQRPSRGRTWPHSSHPSFYPRFLNRVLGCARPLSPPKNVYRISVHV